MIETFEPTLLRSSIGNVITPNPPWPEYVMDLIADCVNVVDTDDEGWHWAELQQTMLVEMEMRGTVPMC